MPLVSKTFSQIITFSRTSGATWFNAAGNLVGVDFSTTSVTIGTGTQTFTLDATAGVNRSWATGDSVLISDQSNSANNMTGTVTSYAASTQVLVVNVTSTNGSGTIASWRVSSLMPRFDYDPSTLAAQGLLIEESRTNSIRNNTMVGAVAGTPGTQPTNWATTWVIVANGLSFSIAGVGTESGIAYVDVRIQGTSTSSSAINAQFESSGTQIVAANGQTWTHSVYWRVVAGSIGNLSVQQNLRVFDSGGVALATSSGGGTPTTAASIATQRSVWPATITNASTAFVSPGIRFAGDGSSTYDVTIRIGLPQLENNNISTGVASATVAAGGTGYAIGDVLQIVGGTSSTAARVTVATLSGSAVATVTVSTAGSYSVFPSPQPVSVTAITGTGSSATFNITPVSQTGFATSVIPTTAAAVTRAADVASVNTLSPWYNAAESTLYFEFTPVGMKTVGGTALVSIDNGSNERIALLAASNNGMQNITTVAGLTSGNSTTPSTIYAANTTYKIAFAVKLNDIQSFVNGVAGTVGTTALMPSGLTSLQFNKTYAAATSNNGWIRRFTYYPRRLSAAEGAAVTA